MTKTELIRVLAERASLDRASAERALNALFEHIIPETLLRGESVAIRGFGTFEPKLKAPRVVRHPQSGELIQVPARFSLSFRPASRLEEL